jgi:ubiquinone/menaquinone biosynthesis C-methylase UbiE
MPQPTDQTYLLNDQYRNAANLYARIRLHKRFSLNKYSWSRWIFDQITAAPESNILELGCGPGILWLQNLDRLPEQWHITLSDFSPGMLQEAQQRLRDAGRSFAFRVIDAQSIPFAEASFDVVIANHMLYHVPELARALAEISRVLKPGGRLYASTIGETHLREIDKLIQQVVPDTGWWGNKVNTSFTLEKGREVLSPYFSQIALKRYEDVLVVTEAEPLIAYVLSGTAKAVLVGDKLNAFSNFVEQELATQGAIRITKDSGLFEASGIRKLH